MKNKFALVGLWMAVSDMRKGADIHCPRKFSWIAEISGMTQLISSFSAGESENYYGVSVFLYGMGQDSCSQIRQK